MQYAENLAKLLKHFSAPQSRPQAGQDSLSAVEDRLRSVGRHNLQDLVEFQEGLRQFGRRRVNQLSGFGKLLK